jgi:hypothetical protein
LLLKLLFSDSYDDDDDDDDDAAAVTVAMVVAVAVVESCLCLQRLEILLDIDVSHMY